MISKVIKRDGSSIPFNKNKIENAIILAMKNGSGIHMPQIAKAIAQEAEDNFSKMESVSISQIEGFVLID
ncbi:ATP cone domain-containing protein [Metaclostridioides mangenotii]|uniref:ATP cone domain-containing protein n=1 Tax=Metaclostridioides mangenotii TaxID=1540 RepID=UPI0004B368A3|nr:ATP cone domain-containing protein [Clostridioides mangenotii]